MEQRTDNWYEWRGKGLGSSDAPIIMGVSPYLTPYQLWEQKTNRVKNTFKGNWATNRGNELEPIARAHYEIQQGIDAPAALFVNDRYEFIRASLDGYNGEHGIILEIKCPGKVNHAKALNGEVPEEYYPQLQHQLLACPQAKKVHYYSFDGKEGVLVVVEPDRAYQHLLFETECKFWNNITQDEPPKLSDRDYKKISSMELQDMLTDYGTLQENARLLDAKIGELRKRIYLHEDVSERRIAVGNWRINTCHRKGAVDYSQVPELQGVNLDAYRKSSSTYRTITEVKSDE